MKNKEEIKEKFINERTRIISEMLDNPDKYGIYPTTKCFNALDKAFTDLLDEWAENYHKVENEKILFRIPDENKIHELIEHKAFRVPYDGTNKFYDQSYIEGFNYCKEWIVDDIKNQLK